MARAAEGIDLNPSELEAYRRACLRIEPLAISEEYVRTPSDIAYWSSQYAEVYEAWQLAKFDREREWGGALARARFELGPAKRGAVTTADLEGAAVNDAQYVNAKRQEILLEAEKIRLSGVLEALRAKKDMLVSLGAHVRQEIQSEIWINTRNNQ